MKGDSYEKLINRVIVFLLLFATLFSVVYLPTFADDTKIEGEDAQKQTLPEAETQVMEGVTVVSEEVSRRGEFEKHYLLSDGTYLATTYAEAVHFKDDNGVWQDIDTTLSYDSESASYKTGNNGFHAEFMTESASAKLKNKDGKELSWHYELIGTDNEKAVMKLQKKNAKAQKKQNKTAIGKAVTDADAFTLPNIKSELTFDSAFSDFGADIRYTVSAQKIKEDVILQEKGKVYALEMVVENCSYIATLTDGGKVIFADKAGNEYFYIDPPYMYDSQGSGSTDIDVALKQTGKKVTVTYTPSKTWLDSCERVYPVTFDPAVTTGNYTLNIQDTYVESGVSLSDAEVATEITFGSENAAYYTITKIPYTGHLPIIGASLTLTATSMSFDLAGAQLKLHEISPNVYFNLPETEYENGTHLDTQTIEGYSAISFDVTSVALLAACNRTDTNGLCYRLRFDKQTMQYPNETISFASVEHATTSKRPVFTLRYGYQNPDKLISDNANDDDNRYWITNTAPISYGRQMLWTMNSSLTDYNTNEPRGHFNFTVDNSDPYGMYIYGCYDEKYISAPKSASGAVTSGDICIKPLANATKWIAIRLSHATYAFVLKDAPSMALTRSGSTVKVQQVSSALSEAQEWLVYSTSNSDATEAIDTHPLEEGTYYINSYVTRTFLTNDNGLKLQAGTEAKLGNKMAWDLCFVGNGKYMIRKSGMPNTYLSITTGGYSLVEITANDPPPSALFTPVSITNNYYAFRNDLNLYLKSGPGGLNPDELVLNTTVWRLCRQEQYEEIIWYDNNFSILMGESETMGELPTGCPFAENGDFHYTLSAGNQNPDDICSVNGLTVTAGQKAGIVSITVEHIPTGKGTTCIGFIGDFIFALEYNLNSNTKRRAEASSLDSTTDTSPILLSDPITSYTDEDKPIGCQLWFTEYAEQVNGYYYYYIHTLGIRDGNATDNIILNYYDDNLHLTERGEYGDNELWRFAKSGNGYKIVNKAYPTIYLSVNNTNSAIVPVSDSGSVFVLNEVIVFNSLPTCQFDGTYNSGIVADGTINIKVTVDYSASNFLGASHFQSIKIWETLASGRVKIYIQGVDLGIPEDCFEVRFTTEDFTTKYSGINKYANAITEGRSSSGMGVELDQNWTSVAILINTGIQAVFGPNTNSNDIRKVLIHEFGHALKFAHPSDSEYSQVAILSIMNQNFISENPYVTKEPSFWDKVQFILKWGI